MMHLDLPLAFGQQAIPHPVLAGKIARASLVGVVLAQHTMVHVATMVPAVVHIHLHGPWR